METLSWIFSLQDRLSGPASKMSGSLQAVQARLGGLSKALSGTDSKALASAGPWVRLTGSVNGSLTAFGEVIGAMVPIGAVAGIAAAGVLSIVAAVGALDVALVKGGLGLAKFGLEQVQFQENSVIALSALSGIKDKGAADAKGNELFGRSVSFAQLTPFDTKSTVTTMKTLLSQYKQDDAETIFAAVSDAVTLSGGGGQQAMQLATAFKKATNGQHFSGEALREIELYASEAGATTMNISAELAEQLHVPQEQALKLIETGRVDSRQGLLAVLNAIRTKTGQELGGATRTAKGSVTQLLSNLEDRFEELFLTQQKLASMPGVVAFKSVLKNLGDVLDTSNASGKELQKTVLGIFNDSLVQSLQSFTGDDGLKKMQGLLHDASVAVDHLGDALHVAMGFNGGLISGLASGLGLGQDLFSGPFDQKKVAALSAEFETMGKSIGSAVGHLVRLLGYVDKLVDASTLLGGFGPGAFIAKLDGGHSVGDRLGQFYHQYISPPVSGPAPISTEPDFQVKSMVSLPEQQGRTVQQNIRVENKIQVPPGTTAQQGQAILDHVSNNLAVHLDHADPNPV